MMALSRMCGTQGDDCNDGMMLLTPVIAHLHHVLLILFGLSDMSQFENTITAGIGATGEIYITSDPACRRAGFYFRLQTSHF